MEPETKATAATISSHLKEARDKWNEENPEITVAHTFGVIDEGKLFIDTVEANRGRELDLDVLRKLGYSVEVYSISKWATYVTIRKGRK